VLVFSVSVVGGVIGGGGLGGDLVKGALVFGRVVGLKVLPRCSYAEAYMRRHAEYNDLLASG
jgi:predicted GNAT family acetyltransferase